MNIDWIVRFFCLYLNMMDCKMDAKGVTPMPVAIKTAWSIFPQKRPLDGAP